MDREGYRLFQAMRAGICAGYVEDSRGDIARDDIAPILRKYRRPAGRTIRALQSAGFQVVRTHTFRNGKWCLQGAAECGKVDGP